MRNSDRCWRLAAVFLGLLPLVASFPLGARTIMGGSPDLARLVRASDAVCVAEVEERQCEFVNRRIETTYRLRVDEYLRGSMGDDLEITVFGGQVEEPLPIAQVFDGMVSLSVGQDVLLFLQNPPGVVLPETAGLAPASAVTQSPQITLGDHGVYTILTHPQTGERYVTRFGAGHLNLLMTEEANRALLGEAQRLLAEDEEVLAGGEKAVYLEMGALLLEETAPPPLLAVRNAAGELIPLEVESAAAAPPEEPSVEMPNLRTLDDLCAEIQDLVEEVN